MKIIKNNVLKNQDKIQYLFFAGAGIAGINTILRPDYNLIVYLYLFYVWTMMTNSKVKNFLIQFYKFFFYSKGNFINIYIVRSKFLFISSYINILLNIHKFNILLITRKTNKTKK
jgi:hypothetical protein